MKSTSIASSLANAKKKKDDQPCWLFDAGLETGFMVYSKDIQEKLEDALKSKKTVCSFSFNCQHYQVDLETMIQQNMTTKTTRGVVRLLLKDTHAVLDRDSARLISQLSCEDLTSWMSKHGGGKKKPTSRGKMMTEATLMFHSSSEFPSLLRCDGTSPYLIKNKSGKTIVGGAKPTLIGFLNDDKKKITKEWAIALVSHTDNAQMALGIVSVTDLSESCRHLHEQYESYKKAMSSSKGGQEIKELIVFHGTSKETSEKIIRFGFDWRYNRRHQYGRGNYLATHASYAVEMAPSSSSQCVKTIVVANIVYTKAIKGTIDAMIPPDGYDATVDNEHDPKVFVTYKDNQSVPIAIITFVA